MINAAAVIREVKKAVVGKDEILLKVLLAILARGHILLEDIPGVGKTTIAIAFSRALGLKYNRVQFTPDVLPSDITGYSMYNKNTGEMTYQPGAILCNMFLADELNRATSRTQSALLEAMEEGSVTVDGVTRAVPDPFFVVATQNPVGAAGTQLLPDSQMDRFIMRLSVGYPSESAELEMVRRRAGGVNPMDEVKTIADRAELIEMRREVDRVFVHDEILSYIVALVKATREAAGVRQGGSPRASLALLSLSKAVAWAERESFVLPRDVQYIFHDAVAHRLLLTPEAEGRGARVSILDGILKAVPAPKIK